MIVAIIQARMGSTRLPGKVVMPIAGKSMLARVIDRVRLIPQISWIVVATTDRLDDDPLVVLSTDLCVGVYRGSPMDVLGRYEGTAQALHLTDQDVIVRITADCPLLDPIVSARVMQLFQENCVDYASNLRDWPDGLDTEVFTRRALRETHQMATGEDREHVTPWMRRNLFCLELPHEPPLRHLKWSVDIEEDLEYVREVYRGLGEMFGWRTLLTLSPGTVCPLCRARVPHAQRSRTSIGGPRDYTVWDLHETNAAGGAGIEECQAWAISRRRAETPIWTTAVPAPDAIVPRSPDDDPACRSDGGDH